MNRLINAHLQFIKYNCNELKKKKPVNEHIKFCVRQSVNYGKFLIQMYRGLFQTLDPNYQKQKAAYKKQEQLKIDLTNAWKITNYLLFALPTKMGKNRHEQRQIRLDYIKNGVIRKDIMDRLMQEISGQLIRSN